MSKIATTRNLGGDQVQQAVLLDRGVYGAMFRAYSEPKPYQKWQSTETEEKISLRFLLTHSANERALPKYTAASCLASTKWFYDAKGRKQSRYFEFFSAILAGKYTAETLYAMNDEDLPDLDDLIGYPVQLMIEPSNKPDKNGILYNNIEAIMPAPATMKKAIGEIYRAAEFKYSDKNGLRYMATPTPEYVEPGAFDNAAPPKATATNGVYGAFDEKPMDDEVPF